MDFQWVIRMEKRTASDDVVPLCGIVGDYRTFIEDFKRELELVEWLGRKSHDEKKSTILLDNLKRMAIFALFSYELGRQVKASIFSLKGMLAFFYCPIPRGYYNKDGCSLNFLTISM